jgi:hypothetical protein
MRVADLLQKTEAEYLQLAEERFVAMDTAGHEQRPALLLEAQLYMNQAARLNDSLVADRDFKLAKQSHKLEVWVIVLISFEIVLSLFGLWWGIMEGNKQLDVLSKLNTSADATAHASGVQAEALPKLIEEQKKSLSSLADMNEKLQGSVRETAAMSVAMRKQLKILQDEQASRQAELARKPKLELYGGGIPLNSLVNVPVPVRENTVTKTTLGISLRNSGTASATKGTLRVIVFAKDVSLECSAPFQRIFEEAPDSPQHVIVIPFDYVRPNGNLPMSITATYPPGQAPFIIVFNVDAEEISVGTPLGGLVVTPLKP